MNPRPDSRCAAGGYVEDISDSRLFDHFGPRFRASDHVVLPATMFPPKLLRLRVAFAINNNLNMKLRNSNVVQLSAIECNRATLGTELCNSGSTHHGVLEVDAAGGGAKPEARNRGPKPRPEAEARNEK
jgi:hypothetical protein